MPLRSPSRKSLPSDLVTEYLFDAPPPAAIAVGGTDAVFPVNRVFCVGRNYAEHVREMGFDPNRDEPCYFTKSSRAVIGSGQTVPYPPGTTDLHHEIELVVALGQPGFEIPVEEAESIVFGYAAGLDMTRRDLQVASRSGKGPWDIGKDFENSAVLGPIAAATSIGHPRDARINLAVNSELRQDSDLGHMIWSVPEIIAHLSRLYRLKRGDLIFTGTPDGVGPVGPGDEIRGEIEGVGAVVLRIAP